MKFEHVGAEPVNVRGYGRVEPGEVIDAPGDPTALAALAHNATFTAADDEATDLVALFVELDAMEASSEALSEFDDAAGTVAPEAPAQPQGDAGTAAGAAPGKDAANPGAPSGDDDVEDDAHPE